MSILQGLAWRKHELWLAKGVHLEPEEWRGLRMGGEYSIQLPSGDGKGTEGLSCAGAMGSEAVLGMITPGPR